MSEGRDPIDDIRTINAELAEYSDSLATRPQIIAANKCDSIDESLFNRSEFEEYVRGWGWKLIYVSAATGENLDILTKRTAELLEALPEMTVYESELDITAPDLSQGDDRELNITVENGIYVVEGEWLYNLMGSINFDDRESLMYFQKVLRTAGVIAALEEKGCTDGDTVSMYDFEFDFVK